MGEDQDIVTLAFSVQGHEPAKDLENFVEKGYPFVLDADVSSGEQTDGTYKVFVEMERNKDVPMQIIEIADGVGKLADLDKLKFFDSVFLRIIGLSLIFINLYEFPITIFKTKPIGTIL